MVLSLTYELLLLRFLDSVHCTIVFFSPQVTIRASLSGGSTMCPSAPGKSYVNLVPTSPETVKPTAHKSNSNIGRIKTNQGNKNRTLPNKELRGLKWVLTLQTCWANLHSDILDDNFFFECVWEVYINNLLYPQTYTRSAQMHRVSKWSYRTVHPLPYITEMFCMQVSDELSEGFQKTSVEVKTGACLNLSSK